MKNGQKLTKGGPSGVVISLALHAGAFLLAGLLVVFTVVNKEEKTFEPPAPVERPKMKLKKPKVQVKKSARPKKTNRIVTKVQKADMPDIQLPEMSGIGDGLVGGTGGFDLAMDISEITIFGSQQSIGNDFVGTFYDTKRYRNGTKNHGISREETIQAIVNFMKRGWSPASFSKYYKSPRQLYTTTFAFPQVPASVGPEAFGEKDIPGYGWLAHYKGQLVHHEDIRFRFWAQGDNLIAVRVNGEISVLASWPGWASSATQNVEPHFNGLWNSPAPSVNRKYPLGNNYAVVGNWIDLKAGEPLPMEVIVSEMSGGITCFLLCVEVEGEEYPKNPFGFGPTLPVFKTEEIPLDLKEKIWASLHEGDASLETGPIFKDYLSKGIEKEPEPLPELAPEPQDLERPTVWSMADGKTFEGDFVIVMGDQAVFKKGKNKQVKVPVKALSQEAVGQMQLLAPPKFTIDFRRTSRQLPELEVTPYWNAQPLPADIENNFGIRIKQTGAGQYDHPLTVKCYAIGAEIDGDNWVLLDRREETFVPSEVKNREFSYMGEPVRLRAFPIRDDGRAPIRGVKYGGHLITVTDSRGAIIQHRCNPSFLYGIRNKLDALPVGKHFDKTGARVTPPRPNEFDRPEKFFD